MLYNEKTDAKIKGLLDEGKAVAVMPDEKAEDGYTVNEVTEGAADETGGFLTAGQAAEALGQEVSGENVLNVLATINGAGMTMDDVFAALEAFGEPSSVIGKAEKFDLMFNKAIEDAITNGRKAEGDSFDKELWTGVLNGLPYEKVIAMGHKWEDQFMDDVHAGQGRVSRNGKPTRTVSTKAEDYKL